MTCLLVSVWFLQAQNTDVYLAPDAIETLNFERPSAVENGPQEPGAQLYQDVNVFSKVSETEDVSADLKASVTLKLDQEAVSHLYNEKQEFISLEIPAFHNETYVVELARNELFTDDFTVVTSESNGQPVQVSMGHHYSGVLEGKPNSVVAFSIFEDEIIGMISLDDENIVVMPKEGAQDTEEYLLYSDRDVAIEMPFECEALSHPEMEASPYSGSQVESTNCVRVYLECDHALYNNKGGLTPTINWITAVYNNVATLYNNENISTTISQIFVWTTPDSYSTSSSYTALTQFRSARPSYNGDLAHLAAVGPSGLGGIAWLDVLCSSYGYAYSNINTSYSTVPSYSWTVEVMTHEMGHNLGSNHTQWCGWPGGAIDNCYTTEGGCSAGPPPTNGGTIMSYCHLTAYGINFNNGFGPLPGDKIRAEVAAAGCLGTSCGTSCGVPGGISVSGVTQTSATVSWGAVTGANSYDLEYRVSPSGSWTQVSTTSTSYTIGGLSAGTTYDVRVRAVCTSGTSNWSGNVSFTTLFAGCSVPTGLSVSGVTASAATASWNSVGGANNYNLQIRVNPSGSWTTFTTTSTSYNFSGLTASTSYDVRVRANCTGGSSGYSAIVTFTTAAGGSYCASAGNSCSQEWIRRVRAGSIDRSSGCDGGYYDGTHLSTNMSKGNYNLIYFQAGRNGGSRRFYWRVWVDLNQNGSFDDPGELRISGYSNSTRLLYAWLYIPSSATNGQTRMRVSMRYGGYPGSCGNFSRGEVEDYTINIVGTGRLDETDSAQPLEGLTDVTLSPNPTRDFSRIEFNAHQQTELSMTLIDINGKPIREWNYDAVEGHNFIEVETGSLSSGNYMIRVDDGREIKMLKLLKL